MPELRPHLVAALFPPMEPSEFDALVADIREHGQLEPIITWRGQIADGVHRWRACEQLGIHVRSREWDGQGSLVAFVLSVNLRRRHLTASQKAAVALDVLPLLEQEAKERQAHGQTAPGKTLGAQMRQASRAPRAADDAAKMVGVSPRYVQDAKAIQQADPKLLDAVKSGSKTITEAKRDLKERERETRRAENRAKVEHTPTITPGVVKFATIVIDPPWDWGDEGDADQLGRARPEYDTMPFSDLLKLPVAEMADIDCHLYLWITNRSLPKGFSLLESWGFRYVTCLTWCKPSIGMGNYFRGSTEHLLFGVRGSQSLRRRDVGTWFAAPRGEQHSSKPEALYQLIETCSPGPYLEMFARVARPHWTAWGADAPTAAA